MSESEKNEVAEPKSFGQVVSESFKELGETANAFIHAPKALWGINIPYVIEGLVYFGILTILGKFCSENLQLSDLHAGWVYSAVTAGITFAMLLFGGVSDKIGARNAMAISFTAFVVGRGLVAVSGTFPLGTGYDSWMFFLMSNGLFIAVVAYGFYQPAAYAAVRRYTNPKTAAMGYAVVYGLMNLGAFFSGFISPLVRHQFETVLPPNGLTAVFWAYTILCAFALVITRVILTKKTDQEAVERVARETEALKAKSELQEEANKEAAKEKAEEIKPAGPKINPIPLIVMGIASFAFLQLYVMLRLDLVDFGSLRPAVSWGFAALLAGCAIEFFRHRPFFLGKILLMLTYFTFFSFLFYLIYTMMPVPQGEGVAILNGRNIALLVTFIIFAVFFFVVLKRLFPHYPLSDYRFSYFIFILIFVQTLFAHNWLTIPYYLDRVFRGSFVSDYFELFSNVNPILIFILAPIVAGLTARANVYRMMIIGTMVMALPTFLLAITPNVWLFLTYVLLMSIGEAMWQPRFLQWIAEIAPEGKTGLYMGIGQFPWFLTKFCTGLYSGYFVAKYIPQPETGLAANSETMWLIYAFIAMISPIGLILAKGWMEKGMREKHAD